MLGSALRRINVLDQQTGGMRIAGSMLLLLLVALVSLQATPLIMTKAQGLLTEREPVVPVHMQAPPQAGVPAPGYKEYLARARDALNKLRYTKPDQDNAYYFYQQALREAPGNQEALQGIARIAEIQADLVEWALGLHEYGKAHEYLETGLRIDPDNKRLQNLAADRMLK